MANYPEFINKDYTYAVVGASANPDKYGHKIFRDLLAAGYKAIPVNLKEHTILEQPAYPSLSQIPANHPMGDKIDVVITVVPPSATDLVVEEMQRLGLNKVWMQPGSESNQAVEFCQVNDISWVGDKHCFMSESGIW